MVHSVCTVKIRTAKCNYRTFLAFPRNSEGNHSPRAIEEFQSTWHTHCQSLIRTRRVDKGKSGQAQKTAVSGGFGGGILSGIKAGVLLFWGNRVAFVTQLKSNNSGAAD